MTAIRRHPFHPRRRRAGRAAGEAALALGLLVPAPAWADAPMNYLHASGPKAAQIASLTWALLILSILVVLVVGALVLVGAWRRGTRGPMPANGARQPVERAEGGLSWISIGVGVSTLALVGAMVWTGVTMAAIHRPARPPALTIEVTGHQWWWQVRYMSDDRSRIFETANEIHIPVGEPVAFRVRTADVIHSFWVPALGDKIDLIPNQVNETWLEAGKPGVYRGQCAEFCGAQHAHMALVVVADKPDDFQDWWDNQLRPTPAPAVPRLAQAESRFVLRCGVCHAVRGTPAGGRLGPDLSHLMTRRAIAAATLPNTAAYLSGWIADPQTVKPGNMMPTLDLSGPELASIRAFLETLN